MDEIFIDDHMDCFMADLTGHYGKKASLKSSFINNKGEFLFEGLSYKIPCLLKKEEIMLKINFNYYKVKYNLGKVYFEDYFKNIYETHKKKLKI